MKSRRFSIRFKLFFAFSLVGLITAGLISLQSYASAQKIINTNQANTLTSIRNIKSDQMQTAVDTLMTQFEYFSQNTNTAYATKDLTEAFYKTDISNEQLLEECKEKLDYYYEHFFMPQLSSTAYVPQKAKDYMPLTPYGIKLQCEYIANRHLAPEDRLNIENNPYQQAYEKYHPQFNEFRSKHNLNDVIIVDRDGYVIYSSNLNIDFATNLLAGPWKTSVLREAFDKAKNSGREDFVKIFDFSFYIPSAFTPTAFIASPIVDRGKFLGVLIASVNSSRFDKIISGDYNWEADGLGKTGETYLVGNDLTMRSDSRYVIQNFPMYLARLRALNYDPELIQMIDAYRSTVLLQHVDVDIPRKIFEGLSGIENTTDYLGNKVISAYAPMDIPDLNWGIVTKIDQYEANEPLRTLQADLMQTMVLVACLVIILTLFVSRAITRPIIDLSQAVASLTDGDYSRRINDASVDELGDLSRAFDLMADTINERSQEILKTNNSLIDEVKERRQTERALQQEKDFINAILDSQIILLMITSPKKTVIRVNRTMETTSGYTREELQDTSPTQMFEKDAPFLREAAMKALDGGGAQTLVAEMVARDGSKRVINWIVNTMTNPEDHLIWTGVDITEQKQAEEQLKDNESMLESLTGSAQDAIFISDEHDLIISWNEAAKKMFEYKKEEIIMQPVMPTIVPSVYESKFIHKNDETLQNTGKRGATIELEGIRKNGETFAAEMSMSLLKTRGKWNTLYIFRDISSRKEREIELKKALNSARIAEKAKADFLANMSHEIRTPLNGILGFLELLQQTNLDQFQSEYLKIINSSAGSLLGVINEILDFSKIESGKMQIEYVEFNAFEEFENIVELYTAKANEKKLDLLVDIDTDIPTYLIGDPLRLRQILSNLLSNAVKFTHENGMITLIAKLLNTDGKNCKMRLAIQDTGIGINKDMQLGIFEAFSQADTSVTRRYGGTGLGLAISAQLAKLMSSKLMLESTEGVGSKFWFDITLEASRDGDNRDEFKGLKAAVILPGEAANPQEKTLVRYLRYLGCDVSKYDSVNDITPLSDVNVVFIDYASTNDEELVHLSKTVPGSARIVIASDSERTFTNAMTPNIAHILFKPLHISKLVNILDQLTFGTKGKPLKIQTASDKFEGRVLVAEDNPVNQQLIQIILSNLGIDVDMAEDGQMAYDKAVSGKYDLIFMDIHMPVMDGITVTNKLIAREKELDIPHIPIVALTANVIEENRTNYKKAGMDDFVAKPIVLPELVQLLGKYLHGVESKAPAASELQKLSDEIEIQDLNLLKLILTEFWDQTTSQIDIIKHLLNENNFEEAVNQSINIKSAALNLRFTKVSSILVTFDTCAKSENKKEALTALDKLTKEMTRLKEIYAL